MTTVYDADVLPAPCDDVHAVAIADEYVLVRDGWPGAHVLDRVAFSVLVLLQDRPTRASLVAELVGLSGADAAEVTSGVATALEALGAAGLLSDPSGGEPPPPAPAVWPLPRTACQATFDSWATWQPVVPVRAGRHVLGLRTDDARVAAGLADLVGARSAPEEVATPAHLSLETSPPPSDPLGARPLARLSWGCETVATARCWEELVPAMAAWVASVARLDGEQVLGLVGTAVRMGDRVAVLPAGWSGVSARRRLSRIGDPLPGPVVVLAGDRLRVLADDDLVPVSAWVPTSPHGSPAHAVADAYARLVPAPARPQTALEQLAVLVEAASLLSSAPNLDLTRLLGDFFPRIA